VAGLVAHHRDDVRFLMVGYGPSYQQTKQLVDQLLLTDKFIFTGNVSPEEVPALMNCMDIILLPRPSQLLNQVAVPLKLLEAMAMGKAVVVTPVKGLSEIIVDRVTGFIAGPSTQNIALAVLELLDDRDIRIQVGKSASQEAISNYTWDLATKSLLICYQRAIQSRGKGVELSHMES
jgi:glycosyltransferase involved in cell wall biosynthesis